MITVAFLLVGLISIFYLKFIYKTSTTAEAEANKKSLQDLLLTPNQSCTFQISDENTGTLFASESNFRVDFTNDDKGKITKSHMISDLTNVFLWFDDKKIGIRVAWPIVLDDSELDLIAEKILDIGISVESQCRPWRVDSSKFELPHIDFKNFGKKIPGSIYENEDSLEKKTRCAECQELDPKEASECRMKLDCG